MWNGTMFIDLDWPLNASSLLSASAELLVYGYMGGGAGTAVAVPLLREVRQNKILPYHISL